MNIVHFILLLNLRLDIKNLIFLNALIKEYRNTHRCFYFGKDMLKVHHHAIENTEDKQTGCDGTNRCQ